MIYEKIAIDKDFDLIILPTNKFKTNYISVYMARPLDRKEVTKNALLPYVLNAGSNKYKDQVQISNRLDELYGASFGCGVTKSGERHITSFKMTLVNDLYLDEAIFEQGVEFLKEIILNPLVNNSKFDSNVVSVEKEKQIESIRSRINDKARYASERLIEEMCKDEVYSIYDHGYEEDMEIIDEANLYEFYKEFLATSKIYVVVAGEFDKQRVIDAVKNNFKIERGNVLPLLEEEYKKEVESVKYPIDNMNVVQGKLCLGFRNNVYYKDEDYYNLIMYSNVLGGGAHSKLFVNVREKESLCYYIYSSVDKYKSLLNVSCGIEIKDYDRCKELILKEMDDIKNGVISDDEFDNSKKALINGIKSMKDSIRTLSNFAFAQCSRNTLRTPDEIIELIDNVTKEDIINIANKIKLDTVYFLRD